LTPTQVHTLLRSDCVLAEGQQLQILLERADLDNLVELFLVELVAEQYVLLDGGAEYPGLLGNVGHFSFDVDMA